MSHTGPDRAEVTIAVVDDHPTTRAGTRLLLTEAGFTVVAEAATLAETRRLLAHTPPTSSSWT
jgi:DNA-binding NarL/FixJ family response regulator